MAKNVSECLRQLRRECDGHVLDSARERDARARDFGAMFERMPAAVLQPANIADVRAAVRIAKRHGLQVTARGAGHSQSGQGLGDDLVLEMTALHRVRGLDPELIELEAGALWRTAVDASYARGMLPVGLTHVLDTSIAGTLSVAGVGSETFACGPQVDNVLYLDVVTCDGDVVRCSAGHPLFDAVRAGLGQCGIIVGAGYPVRPCGSEFVVRSFMYEDMNLLADDLDLLTSKPVPGRLIATRIGTHPLHPDRLIAGLFVSSDQALPTLRSTFEPASRVTRVWSADGLPGHPFFRVCEPVDSRMKHPWVDTMFPFRDLRAVLNTLANNLPLLQHGPAEVMVLRRGTTPAPLFITPDDERFIGIGVYTSFYDTERALELTQRYERDMLALGGKRYLAGYFDRNTDWASHYGKTWPAFQSAKKAHDPHDLLSSSVIRWC